MNNWRGGWALTGAVILWAALAAGCAHGPRQERAQQETREAALALIDEGHRLREEGSPLQALERYNRAVTLYEMPRAWFEMGRLYEALGESPKAAAAYNRALELEPEYREARLALLALGFAPRGEVQPGELEQARQWAAENPAGRIEASTEAPVDEEALRAARERLLAETARERQPTEDEVRRVLFAPSEEALPSAEQPTQTGGSEIILGSFGYHQEKAEAFRARGQYDLAAQEYQRALAAEPGRIEARLELGDVMLRLERHEQARVHYEMARRQFPDSPRPELKLGNLMLAMGRREEARGHFRLALAIDPRFTEALNNLAVLAMQDREHAEAIRLLDEALRIDPEYANAHLNRGILAGDVEQDDAAALGHFRSYVELGGERAGEVQRWIAELEQPQP